MRRSDAESQFFYRRCPPALQRIPEWGSSKLPLFWRQCIRVFFPALPFSEPLNAPALRQGFFLRFDPEAP